MGQIVQGTKINYDYVRLLNIDTVKNKCYTIIQWKYNYDYNQM